MRKLRVVRNAFGTYGKQNHNGTLNELFGLKARTKDPTKQSTEKIKDSSIGKRLEDC